MKVTGETCQAIDEHQIIEFESTHIYRHQHDVLQIFKALADEKRLKIVLALYMYDGLCVQQVADILQESVANTSHHLRFLKRTYLAKSERQGKHVIYTLADEHVYSIVKQAYEHTLHDCDHLECK